VRKDVGGRLFTVVCGGIGAVVVEYTSWELVVGYLDISGL
jgi:hypothetical protein